MTAPLWPDASLLIELVLALMFVLLLGVLHLIYKSLMSVDDPLDYRTADSAAMARDMRKLRQCVPAPARPTDPHRDVRIAACAAALQDVAKHRACTANPHPQGDLAHVVWASSYQRTKAQHANA